MYQLGLFSQLVQHEHESSITFVHQAPHIKVKNLPPLDRLVQSS